MLGFAVHFRSVRKLCKTTGAKPFFWAEHAFSEWNQHVLTSLHPILIYRVKYWTRVELLLSKDCYCFYSISLLFPLSAEYGSWELSQFGHNLKVLHVQKLFNSPMFPFVVYCTDALDILGASTLHFTKIHVPTLINDIGCTPFLNWDQCLLFKLHNKGNKRCQST